MTDKLIINAAITGMIPMPEDNASVPITVDQIIAEARRVRDAGASIIHVHARGEDGTPTADPEVHRAIIHGIREACGDLIISGTTSGRNHKTFMERAACLAAKPDMASLTLGSMNFPTGPSINDPQMIRQLAERMRELGVVPELECFDVGMIDYARDWLLTKGIIGEPLYFNILLGSLGTAAANEANLRHMVGALPEGSTWAGAGIGRFQQPVTQMAVELGGHVRVGLEDNLWYDTKKTQPATNVGLVERVAEFARKAGREPATAAEARGITGLADRRTTVVVNIQPAPGVFTEG